MLGVRCLCPPPAASPRAAARSRRLLATLGVRCDASDPLTLVYGYSMGALQAYEWAVAFPGATPRIAAVCGQRCNIPVLQSGPANRKSLSVSKHYIT